MLSLKIKNKQLDLPDDVSITLKLSSPIFNKIGDYTYPFKLPATPRNIAILGFKHRIENNVDPFGEFDASLEINSVLILQGSLKILKSQSDFYEVTLFMDKGDFNYKRRTMTLQDIDMGEMVFPGETIKIEYFNACKNIPYPGRNFAFPEIENLTYFEELPVDPWLHYMNYYYYDVMNYFSSDGNRTVLVPMLYLRFVLDKIFERLEYKLDDSFFTSNPDYNSLVIYNSVDCNTDVTGFFAYDKLHLYLNYHVPIMGLNDFLSELETFFNIRFFVNNITKTVRLMSVDSIVKSVDAIEFSNNASSFYTESDSQISGYHLKMNMDTDDTYWADQVNIQTETLNSIKNAVQRYSDLPPWPSSQELDIRWVKDESCYYVLWNHLWATFDFILNNIRMYSEYIYRQNDQAIETKFSTLMSVTDSPHYSVVGAARANWKETGPKLFFAYYHDQANHHKMVARHFTDSINLFYPNANGLSQLNYKAYFDFRSSAKTVNIVKQMSIMELKDMDFSKKHMINGNKFLFSDIQVTISQKGIMPAKIKAYTIM